MKEFDVMGRIFFIISIVLLGSNCFAQTDFKAGFINTLNGKYIYGYVKIPSVSSEGCQFHDSKDATPITYKPEDILGFGFIPGKNYLSHLSATEGWQFLEVIREEPVLLLKNDKNLFIKRIDSLIVELRPEDYRMKLLSVLRDCQSLRTKIKHFKLSEANLTDLINEYELCGTSGVETYERNRQLSIATGWTSSSITFQTKSSNLKYWGEKDFIAKTPLTLSVITSLRIKKFRKSKISFLLYGGLLVNSLQYHRKYSTSYSNAVVTSRISIKQTELGLPLGFQLRFGTILKPYFRVGTIIPIYSAIVSSGRLETLQNKSVYFDDPAVLKQVSYKSHLQVGLGLSFNLTEKLKGFIELNSVTGSGTASIDNDNSTVATLKNSNLLLGIIF